MTDINIYTWDLIAGELVPLSEDLVLESPTGYCEGPDGWELHMSDRDGWEMQHIITMPDGTQIVIEKSERGHAALLVTTIQGDAVIFTPEELQVMQEAAEWFGLLAALWTYVSYDTPVSLQKAD